MASYFNLGTEQTPRWINLEHVPGISAKKLGSPGKSEVHLRGGPAKNDVVRGEAADRLIAQLEAHPDLKKLSGV